MSDRLKQKRSEDLKLISELNVVPYIDVMLVLLIIFMVTAPMLQHSIDIELPETTQTEQATDTESEPIIISININGEYFVNSSESPLSLKELLIDVSALKQLAVKETRIFLRADKGVVYDEVINVMANLKNAGFNKIGLMTQNVN